MKKLEVHLDKDTTHTFEPYAAELMVRGVVVFEAAVRPEDLGAASDLLYDLMEGDGEVDENGQRYKPGKIELRMDENEDNGPAEAVTALSIGYRSEMEGQPVGLTLGVSERTMIDTWAAKGRVLNSKLNSLAERAEAGETAAEAEWRLMNMVVEGLKFVSGEPADFAPAFYAWAAANDRDAGVRFPTALPMAA